MLVKVRLIPAHSVDGRRSPLGKDPRLSCDLPLLLLLLPPPSLHLLCDCVVVIGAVIFNRSFLFMFGTFLFGMNAPTDLSFLSDNDTGIRLGFRL